MNAVDKMWDVIRANKAEYYKKNPTDSLAVSHACYMAKYLCAESVDLDSFVSEGLGWLIRTAMFQGASKPIPELCRDFCHICMVDPALVEAHCGMRFEKWCITAYNYFLPLLTQNVQTASGTPFQPKAHL